MLVQWLWVKALPKPVRLVSCLGKKQSRQKYALSQKHEGILLKFGVANITDRFFTCRSACKHQKGDDKYISESYKQPQLERLGRCRDTAPVSCLNCIAENGFFWVTCHARTHELLYHGGRMLEIFHHVTNLPRYISPSRSFWIHFWHPTIHWPGLLPPSAIFIQEVINHLETLATGNEGLSEHAQGGPAMLKGRANQSSVKAKSFVQKLKWKGGQEELLCSIVFDSALENSAYDKFNRISADLLCVRSSTCFQALNRLIVMWIQWTRNHSTLLDEFTYA